MRWWWFGPAATNPEITRELEQMKAAGIGGVEIANLYPLALDDAASGFRNTPFLSPGHLEALRFANEEARRLGLRVDVTLGSGWPFGGPHIPVSEAAGKLRITTLDVPAGAASVKAPFVDTGEMRLAAFLGENEIGPPADGVYNFPAAGSARTLTCFLSSRTGMMVKRPSVGAAGFVLDHYDKAAYRRAPAGGRQQAALRVWGSSALRDLQRQPGGICVGLDTGAPFRVSKTARL